MNDVLPRSETLSYRNLVGLFKQHYITSKNVITKNMAVQTERGSHIASFNAHSSREPKFVPTAAFYAQHPELKGLFPAKQPDIQWHPKSDVYAERTKRRLQTAGLLKTLPEGWPANVEGPEVWEGKDLSANGNEVEKTSLIVYLSRENVSDLEKATNDFKKSGESIALGFTCGWLTCSW
jgi:hypothetical protein